MMSKKDFIILKIKENFLFQIIVCIALSSFVIICFSILNKYIDKKNFRKYAISENINLINAIEEANFENNRFSISGYAFILEKDSNYNSISLFLRSLDTNKEIWLDTYQYKRNDVNSYYECEYDYNNSGFIATTNLSKIKRDEIYEIVINIDYIEKFNNEKNRITVSTQSYILNNEIYDYNPNDFKINIDNVKSQLIKEVFLKGKLCFSNNDEGLYVYLYEGKLYWIATKDFKFNNNGMTYIIYHLHTSQIDRLPDYSKQNRYDNLDFAFEQYEIKDQITEPYRIAVRDLPKEYAVTYMATGVFDRSNNKTNWIKYFQLKTIPFN